MSKHNSQTNAQADHITPVFTYLKIGAALFVLTIVTVAVSRFDFGGWNLVVAMLIAVMKAVLVALFFMHLLHDSKLYGSFFAGALVFLGIFIVLTMFDTLDRGDVSAEEAKPIRAAAEIYGADGKPLRQKAHEEGTAAEEQHERVATDSTGSHE